LIELEDCQVPVQCASCAATSSQRLVFAGKIYVPLCQFCMEVAKDILEENLED
jgi:hypothetical protein